MVTALTLFSTMEILYINFQLKWNTSIAKNEKHMVIIAILKFGHFQIKKLAGCSDQRFEEVLKAFKTQKH